LRIDWNNHTFIIIAAPPSKKKTLLKKVGKFNSNLQTEERLIEEIAQDCLCAQSSLYNMRLLPNLHKCVRMVVKNKIKKNPKTKRRKIKIEEAKEIQPLFLSLTVFLLIENDRREKQG